MLNQFYVRKNKLVDNKFIYSWCNTCTMIRNQHINESSEEYWMGWTEFCGNRNQSTNYISYQIYWIYDWATNHNIMYTKFLYQKHQVQHFHILCNFIVLWKYFIVVYLLQKSFNWFFLQSFSCFFHLTMNFAAITTILFASPWTILYNVLMCWCCFVSEQHQYLMIVQNAINCINWKDFTENFMFQGSAQCSLKLQTDNFERLIYPLEKSP